MKLKYIFILTVILSLFSCKSDDKIDSSQILKEYTEPPLNFLITIEQFIEENGVPDTDINFRYNSSIDGEKYRTYLFNSDKLYDYNSVFFNANQPNFDFLFDFLNQKYGNDFVFFGSDGQSDTLEYRWNTPNYYVALIFSEDLNRDGSNLLLGYGVL